MQEQQTPPRKFNASDHLANERTFLAWIRTSIAIMGFGFVVVKFTLFIKQLSYVVGQQAPLMSGKGYSGIIGIFLVISGGSTALLAYIRYRKIEQKLADQQYFPTFRLSLITTLFILAVSILLILYLLPGIEI